MGSSSSEEAVDHQAVTVPTETDEKPTKLQRVKNYFFDRGLELRDIPTAFVWHEVIGLGMAAGFWSGCYIVQPSKTIMRFASGQRSAQQGSRAAATSNASNSSMMAVAERQISSWGWLQKTPLAKRDPQRLTVSLAESLALRAGIKPITFPFKLWASWQMTLATKQAVRRIPFPRRKPAAADAS
mmetsp:Transcript_134/g.486  ORF Transcript_134/g.486 Transcript_134/m.486 type:complete len:184 (-) Transcript_134:218-769(-)